MTNWTCLVARLASRPSSWAFSLSGLQCPDHPRTNIYHWALFFDLTCSVTAPFFGGKKRNSPVCRSLPHVPQPPALSQSMSHAATSLLCGTNASVASLPPSAVLCLLCGRQPKIISGSTSLVTEFGYFPAWCVPIASPKVQFSCWCVPVSGIKLRIRTIMHFNG